MYVASPLGFTRAGQLFADQVLLPALKKAGIDPLDPWDDPGGEIQAAFDQSAGELERIRAVNELVGRRNVGMIERADAVLAVLDGPDVDSGTAAEIGYASALPRPIVGWRSDVRQTGDNAAAIVNLQVEHFIRRSGGAIYVDLGDAVACLLTLLHGR